jgi:uncharacterized membrane protein YbhN (UPF0104 family)
MSTAPSSRATALRLAGNVVAVVAVIFVFVRLRASVETLPALTASAPLIAAIVAGVGANLLGLALATSAWQALLRSVGVEAAWRACAAIVGRSNIAKYVPGNIFHLVGRVGLAADAGLPSSLVVATLTAETAIVIGVAGLLGAPAAVRRLQSLTEVPAVPTVAVAVAAAVAALAALAVLLRRRGIALRPGVLGTVVALDIVTYVVHGTTTWWLLSVLAPAASTTWWVCVSGFSLAWVLGFVVPGAPGGIGVREAVFIGLVGSDVTPEVAAAVSATVVVGRMQSVVGDVIVFVAAQRLQRRLATSR